MKKLIILPFLLLTLFVNAQSPKTDHMVYGPIWMRYTIGSVTDSMKIYFSGTDLRLGTSKQKFYFTDPVYSRKVMTDTLYSDNNLIIVDPGVNGGNPISLSILVDSLSESGGSVDTLTKIQTQKMSRDDTTQLGNRIRALQAFGWYFHDGYLANDTGLAVTKLLTDTIAANTALIGADTSYAFLNSSVAPLEVKAGANQTNVATFAHTGDANYVNIKSSGNVDISGDYLKNGAPLSTGAVKSGPVLKNQGDSTLVYYESAAAAPNKALYTNDNLNFGIANSNGDSIKLPKTGGIVGYNNGAQIFNIGTSDHSLGIGLGAYNIKSGTANIGIGYYALSSNNSSGNYNTATGHQSLSSIRDASNNIAIGGFRALHSHRTGNGNIAIGSNVLSGDTAGYSNTAVGDGSMNSNKLGYGNTAIGAQTLIYSIGDNNIALGGAAGKYNVAQSNRLYINSISRGNLLGDTTKSIIYGLQAGNTADQRLYLNTSTIISGQLYNNNPHCALYRQTDTTISASQNVWYKIGGFVTKDADYFTVAGDSIQFTYAGSYAINFTTSFSGANNEIWEIGVFKGGAVELPTELRYTSTSDVGNMSCPVYISVTAGQWISFKIRNTTDNDDPTIKRFSAIVKTEHLTL